MFDPSNLPAALRHPEHPWAARFEDAGLNASAPAEQFIYDGWLLRGSPGKAKRARSVNAIGNSRLPLDEKIAHVIDWYAQRRLPALFRMTPFSADRGLDDVLAHAGFRAFDDTRVMHAPIVAEPVANHPTSFDVRVVGAADFAEAAGILRGSAREQVAAHAARLQVSSLRCRRLLLHTDGEPAPVACGQIVVEGPLAGIYDVVVASDMRCKGLATFLVTKLVSDAVALGARHAYLQVDSANAAARSVYRRFGFVDSYAYWYRTRGDEE